MKAPITHLVQYHSGKATCGVKLPSFWTDEWAGVTCKRCYGSTKREAKPRTPRPSRAKPKRQVFCVDCGDMCGWTEGRGRNQLRCYQCFTVHIRAYNAQAKRKERLKAKVGD